MSSLHIDRISLSTFNKVLSRYPTTAPSALADLDALRYDTIPTKLADSKGTKHLQKPGVEKLVEWKLKHGTFRPSLMKLIQENPPDAISSTTQSAFSQLPPSPPAKSPAKPIDEAPVLQALKTLTQLRGIGPATASLLLSVCRPDEVPFFSDELFRWSCWDADVAGAGKAKAGRGWDTGIKYNVKEYKGVLEGVGRVRERLGVRAVDVERVAYVLGSERADVGGDGDDGQKKGGEVEGEKEEDVKEEGKKVESEGKDGGSGDMTERRLGGIVQAIRDEEAKTGKGGRKLDEADQDVKATEEVATKKGAKRKAQAQLPAEGTRRSTRRKA